MAEHAATLPPILSGVLQDLDGIVTRNAPFGVDALLLAAQAVTEAAVVAERHRERAHADGFGQIARRLRAAAQQIEARVPVRALPPAGEPHA